MITAAISFTAALVASLVLTAMVRSVALRVGAVDRPDGRRKLHAAPIPVWGGVAVFVAFLVGGLFAQCLPLGGEEPQLGLPWLLVLSAASICLLGGLDDHYDINGRYKLLLQIVAVLPIVLGGYFVRRVEVFDWVLDLGWWGAPLSVLWLVGCINAMNLLDGMDGMASTVGMIAAAAVAVIASLLGHPHVAFTALLLAGALAGFLVYNLPPASIFLGDCGSTTVGLVIGVLALQGALTPAATVPVVVPLAVLVVPLLDTSLAIVRRRLTGRSFCDPDREHLHHRLRDRGWSVWQALALTSGLCLTAAAAAVATVLTGSDLPAMLAAGVLIVALVRTRVFGFHEWLLARRRLATACANLAVRVAPAAAVSPEADADIESLWLRFVDELRAWPVTRAELAPDEDPPSADLDGLSWQPAGDGSRDGFVSSGGSAEWTWSVAFRDADDAPWRIRLIGRDETTRTPWYLLPMVRHVAAFVDRCSTRVLPRGGPTILRFPAVDERPASRPAQRDAA